MNRLHLLLLSVFTTILLVTLSLNSGPKIHRALRKTLYGNNMLKGKFYSVRGFQMYAEAYGEGEPLLMIHGNGGSIVSFNRQIPYFSKKYKVIVADSRAQGKSVDPSDSLTYEQMADDYAALLEAMNVESANIIGWSDGGIIGLMLAMRHPEKVKKVVISGANLRPDSTAVEAATIQEIMPRYHELKDMFAKPGRKKGADSTEFKLTKLLVEQPHIEAKELKKISAPVLVVGGDHDLILPSHTLEIFQAIPNAYLWILPNSSHATLIEFDEEFNIKTAAFFQGGLSKSQKKRNLD